MQGPELKIECQFQVPIPELPELHRLEAEMKARSAYVMTLLGHGDISAGRAAELLGIDRAELSELMSAYEISPFPLQTMAELEREVTQAMQTLEKYKK
ncbi:MAG: UPF0175 family protein [Hormoscilla sp.]